MSLRNRMILFISLPVITVFILLSLYTYHQSTTILDAQIRRTATFLLENYSSEIQKKLLEKEVILSTLSKEFSVFLPADLDIEKTMSTLSKETPGIQLSFIGLADGRMIDSNGSARPLDYDPRTRDWYKQALASNGIVYTDVYLDYMTQKPVISIVQAIRSGSGVIGVVGIDLFIADIQQFVHSIEIKDSGTLFIVNKSGKYISHDHFKLDDTILEIDGGVMGELGHNILSGKPTFQEFTSNGVRNVYASTPISKTGWAIVVAMPKTELYETIHTMGILSAAVSIIGAILIVLILYFVARSIASPLEELSETAQKVGRGELNQYFPVKGSSEVKKLALALNEMRISLLQFFSEKELLLNKSHEQNIEITHLLQQMSILNLKLSSAYDDNENIYLDTIKALADSIEAKDPYTRGHSDRVMAYAEQTATALGWSSSDIKKLKFAAILHDIGKIAVSDNVLNKQESLTTEEFSEIKTHPDIGRKIIQNIQNLPDVSLAIYQHHEQINGQGYPLGITGDQISPMAKIIAIADAFDAMTSDRAYRKKLTLEAARLELLKGAGKQFDFHMVKLFCTHIIPSLYK